MTEYQVESSHSPSSDSLEFRLYEFLRDTIIHFRRRQERLDDNSFVNQLKDDKNNTQNDRYSTDCIFEKAAIRKGAALFDELFKSKKEKLDEEYNNIKKLRGMFALNVIGIREISYEIKKYLSIKDFISFGLVSKRTNSPLIEFPNRPKLLEMSLRAQRFNCTLELFQNYRSLDVETIFDIKKLNCSGLYVDIGTALKNACYYGHMQLFQYLVNDRKLDPSVEESEAIILASIKGNMNIVRLLLEDARVDPTANGNFVIRLASDKGHLDIVCRLLEDPRVDPSADNNSAVWIARENWHINVVNRLLLDERVHE